MHGMVSELREQVHKYFANKQELIDGEKMFLAMLSNNTEQDKGNNNDDDRDWNPGIGVSGKKTLARKRHAFFSDMTFQLIFFGGWSFREIAAFCRCEHSTVSSRYYHGLERMYSRFPWAFGNAPEWMKKKLKNRKKTRERME